MYANAFQREPSTRVSGFCRFCSASSLRRVRDNSVAASWRLDRVLSRQHLILIVFAVSKHLLSWRVFTLQPLSPGVVELRNR